MTTPYDYLRRREQRWVLVRQAVSTTSSVQCLRGSWVAGDFHLDRTGNRSFSDVDLAFGSDSSVSDAARQFISDALSQAGFPLRVSIHREEALARLTSQDARILKMAEFLVHTASVPRGSPLAAYWLAKTSLLLLRETSNEGCGAIAERIGTAEAQLAFAVKLGEQTTFTAENARQLMEGSGNDIAHEFLRRCVLVCPAPAYRDEVADRLRQCESFTPWLLDYVLAKLGATV